MKRISKQILSGVVGLLFSSVLMASETPANEPYSLSMFLPIMVKLINDSNKDKTSASNKPPARVPSQSVSCQSGSGKCQNYKEKQRRTGNPNPFK